MMLSLRVPIAPFVAVILSVFVVATPLAHLARQEELGCPAGDTLQCCQQVEPVRYTVLSTY